MKNEDAKDPGERDRRALSRLDWISTGLLIAALLLAPLLAGSFPTLMPQALGAPDGTVAWLKALGVPLVTLLIVGALGVALWREVQRPVAIGAAPGLAGSGLLLALWAALSMTRTPVLAQGLNALMVLLAAMAMGALVSRLCRDRRGALALTLAIIVAGTLVSGLGINEYLIKWREGQAAWRAFAGFINPDFTAGYLLLTLPLTIAVFVALAEKQTERINDLALGVALVLQAACLLLTGSRTGVIALLLTLVAWGALCAWTGTLRGRGKRIGMALALCALGILLTSAPLRSRFVTSPVPAPNQPQSAGHAKTATALTMQSQSGQFRKYTWNGTIAMIRSNPLLGVGIGSFDIVYPRYGETAYTYHAHNSLLQWTSETGLPGALFLMAVFAAATAFAVNVLSLRRGVAKEGNGASAQVIESAPTGEPSLLLAGLLAAIFGSAVKTFMDSDWYIVSTALTLGAMLGLLVGFARAAAPLATQTPRPLSRQLLIGSACVALLLLWRAGTTFNAHLNLVGGAQALENRQPQLAQEAYRAAIAADPYDPEARLALAQLYRLMPRPDDERAVLLGATHIAPIGKTYYRLGQYYAAMGQLEPSIAAFRRAHELEPKSLQTLRRLGEALERAGQFAEAATAYRDITILQNAPYGTVRAIADEMIETDFAYGHAGLARDAARQGKWSEAAGEYEAAAEIMRLYWARRNTQSYQLIAITAPQKLRDLAAFYHDILTGRLDALGKAHADAQAIPEATAELKRVEEEAAADQEKQAAAGAPQ